MTLTDSFDENTDTPLTDKRLVKERAKDAGSIERRRRATLKGMLSTPHGREFFWWLLEQLAPTQSPIAFVGGAVDVNHTLFKAGKADAGRLLLAEITVSAPDQYLIMLEEEQERKMRTGNA